MQPHDVAVASSKVTLLFCVCIAVLAKGGQIRRRNQSPDWQTQRGEPVEHQIFAPPAFTARSPLLEAAPCSDTPLLISTPGWDPCRVCREVCGQTGEDHRRFGRYSHNPVTTNTCAVGLCIQLRYIRITDRNDLIFTECLKNDSTKGQCRQVLKSASRC